MVINTIVLEKMSTFLIPGLIYGIGCIGLAFSFRFLKFPDFTSLGSIMTGGVVCIWITNISNFTFGLFAGMLTGGFLGLITGVLISKLRIQPVLAGIITYTASFSLGYSLTNGGTIALPSNATVLLEPTFKIQDAFIILFISIFICFLISFFIRTKIGSLVLSMIAEKQFLEVRHRYRGLITALCLFFGNSLVGMSGALYAFKDRSANVISHADFLPIALGAIFGGNAITIWLSNKLHKQRIDIAESKQKTKEPAKFFKVIANIFYIERDDSKKIGVLFFTYVLGSLFIKEIHGLVHSYPNISFKISHIVVALFITFFVWWSAHEN